jgi:hypothetical protein
MTPIGPSSSSASQVYSGVQRNDSSDTNRNASVSAQSNRAPSGNSNSSFQLPTNATPKGDWVLSENANPQNFEANAPRGSYLNVLV